ncbi:MAG: ferrous iron transport protein B [Verrucomicrobia bacterium]|nr:ferrous iron transport protein B [Verrucomicrobiota bacterium]
MSSFAALDEKVSNRKTPALVYVALTGNPNSGKTTLFNALTGLRAKVGNYAGVTVERKEGALKGAPASTDITVLDLPGTYSLSPKSLDEQISRDVLFHRLTDVPAPGVVVIVVDASNLERNLYYATQVIELGYPTLVALNMMDVAEENGHQLDASVLAKELNVPVLPLIASKGEGVAELKQEIIRLSQGGAQTAAQRLFCELSAAFSTEIASLAPSLEKLVQPRFTSTQAEALLLISDEKGLATHSALYPAEISIAVFAARQRLDAAGVDWRSAVIEARYARIGGIAHRVVTEVETIHETFSDKLDRVLTHKVWGLLIFVALMALMFQSIFTFAKIPMDFLTDTVDAFGNFVGGLMSRGDLNDLLVNGVIKGVGAVVVFLPQICLLFLFISLLEDTGYMARAAFLMDRLMSKVGLHGKSFIPMLSSFACAIPGIMATRTIESPKDRLVTILVAPLMSCSARLPVYTVLIAACIPQTKFLGFLGLPGLTMLAMYLLGTLGALGMAWVFKKTLLKGATPMLIMELPPYKRPVLKVTLRHMWDRSKLFLRRAGTVILGINILLWFLATYPKSGDVEHQFEQRRLEAAKQLLTGRFKMESPTPEAIHEIEFKARLMGTTEESKPFIDRLVELRHEQIGENLRHSFAGHLGRLIEPAIAPLGFDWKMGIGIVASFAAREVFVSTMAVVYNVGDYEKGSETATAGLVKTLQQEKRADGSTVYTTLTAVSLMVFYVFALQCVSTVAIVRRETNSWKWPLIQWLYMGALAWLLAFITYQGGRLLGFN